MTAQLKIAYKPSYEGGEAWEHQLEVLRKAVEHLTRKEVAWEIGVTDQALGDALFERRDANGRSKRWYAKWTHIVKAMLHAKHDDISRDLLRRLAEADMIATPFLVEEPVELTAEEFNALYERELRAMGAEGKAVIERVRKRGRR